MTKPSERAMERLEDERNELMNSFGCGPFRDGLVRDRIAAIEEEIRRLSALSQQNKEAGDG